MGNVKERAMELRYHLLFVSVFVAAAFSFVWAGPTLSSVVGFFWPLLLSTGFFLAAVAVLLRISPPPASDGRDLAGEELMDYVAGHPHGGDSPAVDGDGDGDGEEKKVE